MWVIWLGNYWWLFGLVPLFDGHITRKVKWLFWKKEYKEGEKRNALLEWLDAIIFAVVFVTFINTFFFQAFKIPSSSMESSLYTGDHLFVSKLAYGPKMPQTPLTIPFTHNIIGGKESYSTLIQSDYKRLKGFGKVEEGDYVVFGFPHGDTVFVREPAADYYSLTRLKAVIQRSFQRDVACVLHAGAVALGVVIGALAGRVDVGVAGGRRRLGRGGLAARRAAGKAAQNALV